MSLVTAGPQYLADSAADAVNAAFIRRVAVAAMGVALAKVAGAGTTTPAAEVAYARQVMANTLTVSTNSIAWALIADNATGTGSNDQLLLDGVAALWPKLSIGYV